MNANRLGEKRVEQQLIDQAVSEIAALTQLPRATVLEQARAIQQLCGLRKLQDGVEFLLQGVRRGHLCVENDVRDPN